MDSTSSNGTSNLTTKSFKSIHIIYIIIALLIILFNGFVLFIMRKYKSLHSAQNGLLASLAVSDLSSGLVGVPLSLACTYVPTYLCGLCSVSYYFFKFVSISTVLHILAIIAERCFLIVDPILHRRVRATPGRSNLVIIATIWLASLVASSVPWIWVAETIYDCFSSEEELNEGTWNPDSIYELFCFIMFFIIPLLLISIFLTKIFIAVHQFTRRKSQRCLNDLKEQTRLRKTETRIFIVLLSVFVLFIVCWLPYFTVTLVNQFTTVQAIPGWLHDSVPYFRSVTSLLNPLVYAFYKDDFYQAMRRKLRSFKCWSQGTDSEVFISKPVVQIPLVPLRTSV